VQTVFKLLGASWLRVNSSSCASQTKRLNDSPSYADAPISMPVNLNWPGNPPKFLKWAYGKEWYGANPEWVNQKYKRATA